MDIEKLKVENERLKEELKGSSELHTQCIIKSNEALRNTCHAMQREIDDLRQDNEQLKELLSRSEKSPQKRAETLSELTSVYGIDELIDGTGRILDCIIAAYNYSGCDGLAEPMAMTRELQRFFMGLGKKTV